MGVTQVKNLLALAAKNDVNFIWSFEFAAQDQGGGGDNVVDVELEAEVQQKKTFLATSRIWVAETVETPTSFLLLELRRALGAVPLAPRLGRQPDAAEVVPLDRAVGVVAANHLAVGNLEENLRTLPSGSHLKYW